MILDGQSGPPLSERTETLPSNVGGEDNGPMVPMSVHPSTRGWGSRSRGVVPRSEGSKGSLSGPTTPRSARPPSVRSTTTSG